MDSVRRGWVIGQLLGQAINRHREAQPRWAAIAYCDRTGMAWSYNHRSAPRLACGPAERTSPSRWLARGPRGAFACHWADPRLLWRPGQMPSDLPS